MAESSTNEVMPRRTIIEFPELGAVVVESHFTPSFDYPDDPKTFIKRPYLTCSSPTGHELCRIQFLESADDWEKRPLNFAVVHLPQHPTPFIVVVAVQPGGSDHDFESTVVGVVKGMLCDLIPEHPHSNVQGAFCVGKFGKDHRLGALSLNFIWEDGVHYQSHRYECTVYEWTGAEFRKKTVIETRLAYESWKDAAKELGFRCETDFGELLLPEYR